MEKIIRRLFVQKEAVVSIKTLVSKETSLDGGKNTFTSLASVNKFEPAFFTNCPVSVWAFFFS